MVSDDVVIACVAESRPEWYRMVENLAISTRNFGGRLAQGRLAAYLVDGVDQAQVGVLRELGVELHDADRYIAAQPTTNKLRMFEDLVREGAPGLLVAVDCDVVVVGDFLDEARPDTLCAMPAGSSPMTNAQWSELLASLGLPEADQPVVMLETGQQVPAPYLNSGVMLVPASIAAPLTSAWTKYVDLFAADLERGVDHHWDGYWIDQVALTCALLEQEIAVHQLGPHMNLPTAIRYGERIHEVDLDRLGILHYHRHIGPDGELLPSDAPAVNDVIDALNAVIGARANRGPGQPTPSRRSGLLAWGRRQRPARPS